MATQAPLSTYVTGPEGEKLVQGYKDAQANLRQALESRQSQLFDPTLLAISQALGSPTKTGSFGEVLGNVAGAVGTAQEAEQKRSREIAGMKLELAKNELQSYQTGEGQKLVRDILAGKRPGPQAQEPAKPPEGLSPEDAILAQAPGAPKPPQTAQSATGGGLSHITGSDLAALAASGQGQMADALAKAVSLDRERFKVSDGVIVDLGAQGGPKMIADLRVGKQEPTEIVVRGKPLNLMMTGSQLRDFQAAKAQGKGDEYYDKNLQGLRTDINLPSRGGALREIYVPLLGDVRFQGDDRQAAIISQLSEEAVKTRNPTELRNYVNSITQKMPERPAQPASAQSPMDRPPAVAGRQPPAVAGRPTTQPAAQPAQAETDLSGLPLADQNKVVYERLTKADAPAQETAAILQTTATPQAVSSSNRRLKEIGDLVKNNPEVVGLMNKQGVWEAIKTAAAEGIKVGPYQVSAPVKEMLQKSNLTPDQQTVARRLDMLFNEEFFNRAALAKSALGPQISNADSILMRSPMAGTQDSAKLISYWSLHGQLVNRQNEEMHKAYNQWFDQTKGKAPVRQFFNKEGRVIMEKYNPYFERLQDRFEAR
jgi:hypothetical protein